jgi:hypothetical protein
MATSARQSWKLAEERCFQYLKVALQVVSDTIGYSPEMPSTFGNGDNQHMWAFRISGAGITEPMQIRQNQRPACAWSAGAMLQGIFNDRDTAMDTAGLVMDALPLDVGELEGITRFNYTEFPTIEREEITLNDDQSSGGLQLIWRLDIPMQVVFSNTRN